MPLIQTTHTQHKVLVVDDEKKITDSLRHLLEQDGYRVFTATDGQQALKIIHEEHPCLILSDIMMPNLDGLTLCQMLKHNKNTRHIPVMLVTAKIQDMDRNRGMASGAFDYIKKPFDRGEISVRVRNQIQLHEALRDLKETEKRYRTLFESAGEGIVVIDIETRTLLLANTRWRVMMGYGDEDIAHLPFSDLLPREQLAEFAAEFSDHVQGQKRMSTNIPLLRRDGTILIADLSTAQMTLDNRETLVGFCLDVSERIDFETRIKKHQLVQEKLEKELRHAQKMETVGQLASGIAHEINTPAQYVGDNTRFLKESFGDLAGLFVHYEALRLAAIEANFSPELVGKLTDAIEENDLEYLMEDIPQAFNQSIGGIEQIAAIVRATKEFAHSGDEGQSAADINHAIRNTLLISSNEHKYVARVKTEFGDLPPVICHVSDLSQVFLNLIVNAAHAIGDVVKNSGKKGGITIRTSHEADQIRIEIADTGTGIPPAVRDRIFEPFFTSKKVGKGSGQGLAISRGVIVDRHGGTLEVETAEGRGTTFIITLPVDGIHPGIPDDEE